MKIKQRLALVEDKSRLVPYDDKAARFLFAAPDQEVPDALAEKFGLVDGMLPEPEKGEAPVPEWEKEPNPDDPAWSQDPETGKWSYTHESGDDVYINGVLQDPVDNREEWEKDPDPDNPFWVRNPETGKMEYWMETDTGEVYIDGVLQEPPLPNTDDDEEKAEKAADGDTPPEAGTEGEETPAETKTEEGEEVKKGDKPEDKQKAKPEDKRILKSENKREKGRR